MTQPSLPRAYRRGLVAVFALAITVPLVGTVVTAGEGVTLEDNRVPAPWPVRPHDLASLAAWPEQFTKYFADHFAFRAHLVRWQARLRVGWLRSSPTPDVLLGTEGWLFYGADGAVEEYTAARPFSARELDEWRDTLQHTQDWLDRRGIGYAFVVAPDKHWVYPEHMPGGLNRREGARVDQLLAHLRTRSTVRTVDVRDVLRAAARDERLYHRTDTHWNDLGAFLAYQQVMARVGPPLGLRPRTREQMELRIVGRDGMDLAGMLGLRRVTTEEDLQLEPMGGRVARVVEPGGASRGMMYERVVTEGPADGPRALVFRDSFGSAMIPFLSEHFSRAVYVWQNNFDPNYVDTERPAVVIQEWVGRHLYTATPYDPFGARLDQQ
jgi:alginate O-acetyltransferase complex protein AlgJ